MRDAALIAGGVAAGFLLGVLVMALMVAAKWGDRRLD
jgi:hypothetical protein